MAQDHTRRARSVARGSAPDVARRLRAPRTPTAETGTDVGRTRRSRRRVPASGDGYGDLASVEFREHARETITFGLAAMKAMRVAQVAHIAAKAAVEKLGEAMDAWVRIDREWTNAGRPAAKRSTCEWACGHGEVMWEGALAAIRRQFHHEPPSVSTDELKASVETLWVGWASAMADDDLIASVGWPRYSRATALENVRQARARYRRWADATRAREGMPPLPRV